MRHTGALKPVTWNLTGRDPLKPHLQPRVQCCPEGFAYSLYRQHSEYVYSPTASPAALWAGSARAARHEVSAPGSAAQVAQTCRHPPQKGCRALS